jgi:VWFA-related protein
MLTKNRRRIATLLFLVQLLISLAPIALAQTTADKPPAGQDKPLRLRTDEVIVDAIVLDKRGRAVSDLTANDFEVYEDGVKQQVTSFRFESSSAATDTVTRTPATGTTPNGNPPAINLVSLVFDAQTTRDGALRARRAALDFIDSGMKPNDYVAVFGIDIGLLVLSPFTNDKVALKQAVEVFTSRESKKYNAVANEVRNQLEHLVEPSSDAKRIAYADAFSEMDRVIPGGETARDVRGDPGFIDPNQLMVSSIALTGLRVLRVFDRYEREYQGWRSVGALLAIIKGQKQVKTARKTLLLFSEGFAVSPAVQQQYLSIISAANTSGVTIYALDIAGLRIVNPNEDVMRERDAAAIARVRNANPELVSGGVSALGRNEEVARMNTVTTLDELAEETGGYTIKNTNDLIEGMKRILDDLGNHYVLSYLPTNQKYAGEFRHIAVKLARPADYRIRARRGYYALRTLDDSSLMANEIPLLDKMNAAAAVSDFPMHVQALHFRGTPAARQVALYLEFPVSALKFETDSKTKSFTSRYAILALVKNNANEIVRKIGQEYALKGPMAQMEDVQKKPQIFNRLVLLPPGQYTLEAVARDAATGKAAVARAQFEVPDPTAEKLAISSVVLSRGVNPLSEEQKKVSHPLYIEGQAYFLPNLEQSFSLARDKNLLIHFIVYPPKTDAAQVSATLVFMKGGSVFTQAGGALPAADGNGRIAYSTAFGTENFPAGEYELKVTVASGTQRAVSSTRFKIEP